MCWIANNTIGVIVYDGTMEWNRCFFQANEKVQAHCSTGQFHFDKCWFAYAPSTATATVLVTGGGTCAIEGCKFHKTASGPADIRFTQRPSGGPAVGAKPAGPLRTWLPEPASGSATYTRNVTVANCIFDESGSDAALHDGSKAHIVFGEADAPSTSSFTNGSIVENQFSMYNKTATPFGNGTGQDYRGNVPIYIYDGADARGVEISRNITVNYTGDATLFAESEVINSRAIFKVENNPGSSEFIVDSADWEDVTLDFHYRRIGTGEATGVLPNNHITTTGAGDEEIDITYAGHGLLAGDKVIISGATTVDSIEATYINNIAAYPTFTVLAAGLTADKFRVLTTDPGGAGGTVAGGGAAVKVQLDSFFLTPVTHGGTPIPSSGYNYISPGVLMYRGMDVLFSESIDKPGVATNVQVYIDGILQEIAPSGITSMNLDSPGADPRTIVSNSRIAPFFTQANDLFVQAIHGKSIGVKMNIPAELTTSETTGGDFDILVRTHWINRKPSQTGIV